MEIQTKLDNSTLRCIYCRGPLILSDRKSMLFVWFKCLDCKIRMCMFLDDYLSLGRRVRDSSKQKRLEVGVEAGDRDGTI